MTRHAGFVLLLAICCSASLAFAKTGVVKTREGQTYEGDIDDHDPQMVVVTVKGIQTRIPKANIASLDYPQAFEQQFHDRMAKLGPQDVPGRLALAREAMSNQQYVLAREAAESARTIDP